LNSHQTTAIHSTLTWSTTTNSRGLF
jgi:hypothetical protein